MAGWAVYLEGVFVFAFLFKQVVDRVVGCEYEKLMLWLFESGREARVHDDGYLCLFGVMRGVWKVCDVLVLPPLMI